MTSSERTAEVKPLATSLSLRLRAALTVLLSLWMIVCVVSLGFLWRYKSTPGKVGQVTASWPSGSHLPRPVDRPVLIMFAHPMCPCTVASLAELRNLLSPFAGKVESEIVFIRDVGEDEDWSDGDARKAAEKIRGLRIIEDPKGEEARRFGAKTSGHTFLYSEDGRLLFSGGITSARGHQGDNEGIQDIASILRHQRDGPFTAPVFGCSLEDTDSQGT